MQANTHDLLCDKYFEMTLHDGMQWLDQSNVGQLFQKINFGKITRIQFGP